MSRSTRAAARRIDRLHTLFGGATYGLRTGSTAGQDGYVIAILSCARLSGRKLSASLILRVIEEHLPPLRLQQGYVGTWYDPERDESSVEIVRVVPGLEEAVTMASEYGQRAIYDLKNRRTIPIQEVHTESEMTTGADGG